MAESQIPAREVRRGDTLISTAGRPGYVTDVEHHGSTVALTVDWHDGDGPCRTPELPAASTATIRR